MLKPKPPALCAWRRCNSLLPQVRLVLWLVATFGLASPAAKSAGALEDRIASWYRPLTGEMVALSPDGARIAYTRHERGELAVYIASVDRPERKTRIAVEDDRPVLFSREKAPARLRFLRWVSPTRLVFSPTMRVTGAVPEASIFAVNTDGSGIRTLAQQKDFSYLYSPPSGGLPIVINRPTAFLDSALGKRATLLIEATGRLLGQDMVPTEVFTLDTDSGKLTSVRDEAPTGRYFYTRDGEPRLLYSTPLLSERRNFEFNPGGAWGRWSAINAASFGSIGGHFQVTLDNYFGERAFPIGFAADPNVFYYTSNVGRDSYGLYAFDLRTKQPTGFAVEEANIDLALLEPGSSGNVLVTDEVSGELVGVRVPGLRRFTRWLDPKLVEQQRALEKMFPRRTVELLQWDDARSRFLLRVTADGEPGRYHVFSRTENVTFEVLRSAPWINPTDLHDSNTFEFDTPGGVHLSGYLTLPRRPRLNPPPLLIAFSENPMSRAQPGFDREAQVLAEMGFVVARINHRGAGGFGVKHRLALRTEGERAAVEDAVAVVNWIAQQRTIDRRRVATYGRGLGGYLALRTLQIAPDTFRCGVAINSPLSPEAWMQPPISPLGRGPDQSAEDRGVRPPPPPPPPPINFRLEVQRAFFFEGAHGLKSVMSEVGRLTLPVMLIVDEPRDRTIGAQNRDLRSRLRRLDRTAELYETDAAFSENLPASQAKMFREMEGFFNLHLYDFNVKIGPTREVK